MWGSVGDTTQIKENHMEQSLETWKLGYTVVYKASGFPKLGVPVLEHSTLGSILGLPISEN